MKSLFADEASDNKEIFVLAGELVTELDDGREFKLTPGMSCQVAEDINPHRSHTEKGAKLFIVD